MRVIFPNGTGGIAVLIPDPNARISWDELVPGEGDDVPPVRVIHSRPMTLAEIIAKDVPEGSPYRVVEDAAIPTDPTFRDAWTADFTGAPVNTGNPEDVQA
jgi:hypothetical protein